MKDYRTVPWLLDEEEPGSILADAGEDGRPAIITVDVNRDGSDSAASQLAEHIVHLHNAGLSRPPILDNHAGRQPLDGDHHGQVFDRTTRIVVTTLYIRYRFARDVERRRLRVDGVNSVSFLLASAQRVEAWNALQASKRAARGIFD